MLSGLAAGLGYDRLAAALSDASPGFACSAIRTTDGYFLQRRSVLAQDGSRVAEVLQLWLKGVTVMVKVAHVRLCHGWMMFVQAYPRESQEPQPSGSDRWRLDGFDLRCA